MIGMCLCSKPRLSWKIFSKPTINIKFIRFESRYSTNNGKDSRDLPWLQHREDIFKKEPIFHRLAGHLSLRFALKGTKQSPVTWPDFSKGASEAVKRIAHCISCHDDNNELQHFLGPALLVQYKSAFEQLKLENKKIHLDVEGPVKMNISGVRLIIGEAERGDEYVINYCGQKAIISSSEMIKMGGENIESIWSAFESMRFQYDIKFELDERFCILDADSVESNEKEIDRVHSYHKWRFEARGVEAKSSQEAVKLEWNVVDVDDFLKSRYMLPEESLIQN